MRGCKVFGTVIPSQQFEGTSQARAVVAVRSKKEAAKAFGMSLYEANSYVSVTGNDKEVATALGEPGAVFVRALDDHRGEYVRKVEKW